MCLSSFESAPANVQPAAATRPKAWALGEKGMNFRPSKHSRFGTGRGDAAKTAGTADAPVRQHGHTRGRAIVLDAAAHIHARLRGHLALGFGLWALGTVILAMGTPPACSASTLSGKAGEVRVVTMPAQPVSALCSACRPVAGPSSSTPGHSSPPSVLARYTQALTRSASDRRLRSLLNSTVRDFEF